MSTPAHQDRTRMFARVVGPLLAIVDTVAAVRLPDLHHLTAELSTDGLWTWVTGAFTLLVGLVVVALHPYWDSPAAIIISAVGWLGAVKGLVLLAFPRVIGATADAVVGAPGWWRILYVVVAVLGLYVAYIGWVPTAKSTSPTAH